MIDFSFMLVGILMLMALQSGQVLIAGGLFVILLATAKSKALVLASLVLGGLGFLFMSGGVDPVILIVGLLAVLVILVRADTTPAGPQGYYPGGA